MSGQEVVEALVEILPDDFAWADKAARKGRCVEATRIAVAVLRRMGVECKAMACDVDVLSPEAARRLEAGELVPPFDGDVWILGIRCDEPGGPSRDEPTRRRSFGGHLVVVGDDWFADLTAQQFSRPEHNIVVDGAIVGAYWPGDAAVRAIRHDGTEVRWMWRPEIAMWRRTPAWRQDVPVDLLDAMVRRVELARMTNRKELSLER